MTSRHLPCGICRTILDDKQNEAFNRACRENAPAVLTMTVTSTGKVHRYGTGRR